MEFVVLGLYLSTPPISSDDKLIPLFLLVNLNHFRLLRVVGKGAFGKVRIVERKDTGLTFALKYIRKEEGSWKLQPAVHPTTS